MAGGYSAPAQDDFGKLSELLLEMKARLAELERPTGTQTADAVAALQQLVSDLPGQIFAILATSVNTGTINATGNANVAGTVTATTGFTSVGAYNLDVSTLPGTRRTNWINQNGQIGYAPSTVTKKFHVDGYGAKASQFLACMPVVFEYLAQASIRDDPDNEFYDPDYEVPTEVGFLAELLVANGLPEFVFFGDDGAPAGIYMSEFAAVGFVIVGRDHEARLRALEAKA